MGRIWPPGRSLPTAGVDYHNEYRVEYNIEYSVVAVEATSTAQVSGFVSCQQKRFWIVKAKRQRRKWKWNGAQRSSMAARQLPVGCLVTSQSELQSEYFVLAILTLFCFSFFLVELQGRLLSLEQTDRQTDGRTDRLVSKQAAMMWTEINV